MSASPSREWIRRKSLKMCHDWWDKNGFPADWSYDMWWNKTLNSRCVRSMCAYGIPTGYMGIHSGSITYQVFAQHASNGECVLIGTETIY